VTISVTLAEAASKVKIVVFTTAFRKVQSIERDQVPIGVLSVALELKDKWGAPLANGIYYVVVTTQQGRSVGKLLIFR